MKDLLCWEMEDIKKLKLNARKSDGGSPISPEGRKLLEKKMAPDYKVYNYFKEKFDQKLKDFGHKRMSQELDELERVNTEVTKRCEFAEEDNKNLDKDLKWLWSNIQGYKVNQNDLTYSFFGSAFAIQINDKSGDEECRKMVLPELTYMETIRKSQAKKYPKP